MSWGATNMMTAKIAPHRGAGGESCWYERHKAAEIVKEWFDSLPEGRLLNITLEDLL